MNIIKSKTDVIMNDVDGMYSSVKVINDDKLNEFRQLRDCEVG